MVTENIRQLPNLTLTSAETSLLESTLEAATAPEDITLIFPWGLSELSHKRSLNYLQYCLDLPSQAQSLAILRLLGLRPYRRAWWTQSKQRRRRYLKAQMHRTSRCALEKPTGTGYTTDTLF